MFTSFIHYKQKIWFKTFAFVLFFPAEPFNRRGFLRAFSGFMHIPCFLLKFVSCQPLSFLPLHHNGSCKRGFAAVVCLSSGFRFFPRLPSLPGSFTH